MKAKKLSQRKNGLTYQQGLHTLSESVSPGMEQDESLWQTHAAFASVTKAIECKKCGLFFTGILKTASREFSKEYLSDPSKYSFIEETILA